MEIAAVDDVLAPIAAQNPCGVDLRFEHEWDDLERARGDDGFREGMADENRVPPNWDALKEQCIAILRHRSKDLRISMYLVEASVQLDGWEGMRSSLQVVGELLRNYWDEGLYPIPDETEPPALPKYDDRAAALGWLDDKFAQVISGVAYTARANGRNYGFSDLLDARKTGSRKGYIKPNGDPDEKRKREFEALLKAGHVSLDMYDEAIKDTQWEKFEELSQLFELAYFEYKELEKTITEKFGESSPGFPASRERLKEISNEIKVIYKRTAPPPPPVAPGPSNSLPSGEGGTPAPTADGLTTASQAGISIIAGGSWAEAEALIRSGDVDNGLAEMAKLVATDSCGRNRFQRKLQLSEICLNQNRNSLALTILEELSELVDKHHLAEWETSDLVGGVWSRLYKIYRKNQPDAERTKELYKKLSRLDPWQVLTLVEE